MYNRQLINPAVAGSKDAVEFNLVFRSQYVALSDQITSTQGFGVNLPIDRISSGVGLTVVNDLIGYLRTTSVNFNYDYRKKFSFGQLGIGVGLGLLQTGLDGARLRTPDGIYKDNGIPVHSDDYLPTTMQNALSPELSAGIYLNNEKWFAGVSMNHLYSYADLKTAKGTTRINFARNLSIMGGYDFVIGRNFAVMPSTLIKTDLRKVQVELSATMKIYHNILAGVALRGYEIKSLDAAILYGGVQWRGFRLVYSYDVSISYLSGFQNGSHEISLGYDLKLKKKTRTGYYYHNSRFL
jgi:hypothetical protein